MKKYTTKPKKIFWFISVIGIIWYTIGVMEHINQMLITNEIIENLNTGEKSIYQNVPQWVIIAFAINSYGGFVSILLFFFKNKLAYPSFIISFIALTLQMGYNYSNDSIEVYGPGGMLMPATVITLYLFYIIYTKICIKRSWLK